jgi:Fe-S-cluster containining protein
MSELPADPAQEGAILTLDSAIQFACHADLPCFTQCCRDVNIYLTPYDVLRLRRALKMGSQEFLARYTRCFQAEVSHIPVVQLAMDETTLSCKLVTDAGCRVYAERPWACRMYPLDLADASGNYRFFATQDRCFGLGVKRSLTVQEWLDEQGLADYAEMDLALQQAMSAGCHPDRSMDADLGKLMFLAYDLDPFAQLLEEPRFRDLYEIDDQTLQRLREDDEALLLLAFRFIRRQLEERLQLQSIPHKGIEQDT